jgi:hypothetical protein
VLSVEQQAGDLLAGMMKDLNGEVADEFKSAGREMKTRVMADLKANFKSSRHPASPSFFKAVKDYYLEPTGELGHATYVRMGIRFMYVFEEGATITSSRFMVVRLKGAEDLNLPRVGKKNRLRSILEKLNASGTPTFKRGDVFYMRTKKKTIVPIYQLRQSVQEKKRLSFYSHADAIAKDFSLSNERTTRGSIS